MQLPTLRERQGFSHKLPQPLPERVIPPLHVIRLPALLANRFVLIARNHCLVRLPKIRVALRVFVSPRNFSPQRPTRLRASITCHKRDNLLGHGAQGNPDPALVFLVVHERPEFVQLECALCWCWWDQCCVQVWELIRFFLSQSETVWRSTPKVRWIPRRLERSWVALMIMTFSSSL